MPETQIKVELVALKDFFPIYVKLIAKKLKIEIKFIKKYKNFYLIDLNSTSEENYNLIENFYNFGNIFNIKKVIFNYKWATKKSS